MRLRATCHRTRGTGYFHGCYGIGGDQLRGVTREHKGAGHTLAALKTGPGRPARRVPAVLAAQRRERARIRSERQRRRGRPEPEAA